MNTGKMTKQNTKTKNASAFYIRPRLSSVQACMKLHVVFNCASVNSTDRPGLQLAYVGHLKTLLLKRDYWHVLNSCVNFMDFDCSSVKRVIRTIRNGQP